MHLANRLFLSRIPALFEDAVINGDILEIGSNLSFENGKTKQPFVKGGTVRSIFQSYAKSYVGIDLVPGDGVDIVGNAADYDFGAQRFNVVLNLSVMEHEPRWKDLLRNTLPLVRQSGIYVIVCGCENNTKHEPEPWAPVRALALLAEAEKDGYYLPIYAAFEEFDHPLTNTPGVFDIVLRRASNAPVK